MENNNKNLLYAGLAIIVVIIVALIVSHTHKAATPVENTSPQTATVQTPATTPLSAEASWAAWNAMFQKYNGKLVVFAADCTATPVVQNQPKGTTILLMNNSNVSHNITVGSATYGIGALHYKNIVLAATGTIAVSCDNRINTANIIVN
jgi:hypothetical protein